MFFISLIQLNATTNATSEEERRDQNGTATAADVTAARATVALLKTHSHEDVVDNQNEGSRSPHSVQGSKKQDPSTAEGMTGRSSPHKHGEFANAEDAWNWLLSVEKNYRVNIANATMEVQNSISLENTASEDEDYDEEKQYKYPHRGPEFEGPTPARRASSEAWFSACYTDYRESYSDSESEDDADDCQYEADSEGETGDEELTSAGLTCAACRRDVYECARSLLDEVTTTSLREEADVHPKIEESKTRRSTYLGVISNFHPTNIGH